MAKERTSGPEELARDLKRAMAMARLGSWRIDLAARRVTASEEARRIYGVDGEEWPLDLILGIPLPEHRAELDARMRALIETGEPYDVEFRIRRLSDGALLHIHSVAEYDAERGVVHGTIQDITERKEAQETLRQERERQRFVIEGSRLGTWAWNVQTGETVFNRIWAEMLGYTLEELYPCDVGTWERLTHPEDFKTATDLLDRCFRGELPSYECEMRMRHKDGRWVWILDRGRLQSRDAEGRPLMMFGIHVDIDARKVAEARLAHSLDLMRHIIEHSNGGVAVHDRELRYVYVSASYLTQYGLRERDIIGRHHYEIFPDLPEKWREVHRRALRGEVCRAERDDYPRADGTVEWTRWECRPWFEADGAIGGILVYTEIITDRVRAEEALRESEARFRQIYDHVAAGVTQVSLEHRVERANDAFCQMLGYEERELIGMHLRDFTRPEILEENLRMQARLVAGEIDHYRMEKSFSHKSGRIVHGLLDACLVRDAEGKPLYILGSVIDITERVCAEEEREKLQAQLTQAQKMESVGRLAGGVAHDFNNMIGVILGNAEMAMERLEPADPVRDDLSEIMSAARRSAEITRQLLAFARKQTIAPRTLDLNATVEGMLRMLRRLIGEDVELAFAPGADLLPLRMDPTQIDQILANLCVNARDAIAGVGKITIETGSSRFSAADAAWRPEIVPGEYVTLTVSDTGCGMDRQVMERLFEPFFTTKGVGKGTGLGLATVYGIVKQNGGFLEVESEPGRGSAFRIHLPVQGEPREARERSPGAASPEPFGSETVLLVEDEPSILAMTRRMLERIGYRVIPARTPGEAIALAREHAGQIHLLLTDVVMPEMNGRDLARTLLSLYPALRRLFMSGYTDEAIAFQGVLEEGVRFLAKPFTMADLAAAVRAALRKEREEGGGPWNRS